MIGHARHRTGRVAEFEAEIVLTKSGPSPGEGWTPTDSSAAAYGDTAGNSVFVLNPGLWQLSMTGTHTVSYNLPNQAPRSIGPVIECITGGNNPVAGRKVVYASSSVPNGTSSIYNGSYTDATVTTGLAAYENRFNFLFGPVGFADDQFNQASFRLALREPCAFQFVEYDTSPGGIDISYVVTAGNYTITARKLA